MDLLTVLTQCSVPTDITLLWSLALTFSHGHPYTVMTVDELAYGSAEVAVDAASASALDERPLTRVQAAAKLRSMVPPGGSPTTVRVLVGLVPVPSSWASLYQQREEDLLEPCTNVSIASAQLSEFEELCGRSHDARQCALERYAAALGAPLLAEVVRDTIEQQGLDASAEAMLASAVFAEQSANARPWGADRIFVPTSKTPHERRRPTKASESARGGHGP